MNYPVWHVAFGSEWLIAVIATLHVFVSHFAVGGGLFLVAAEARANRHYDPALSDWLRRHTKFFLLLTLVFGALTGVGIWFTIGLISPEATSNLIHIFVWAWAIEWVFFLVEILSIIVYAYSWDLLPKRAHWIVGWVYFAAAYLSLVVIDGILSFQLTPGKWLQTHALMDAFFNPGYLPSLLVRSLICIMLGGLYALLTLSWSKDRTLKAELAKYAAYWVWLPALGLPPAIWWLLHTLPDYHRILLRTNLFVEHFTRLQFLTAGLVVLLTFGLVWLRPRSLSRWLAVPLMVLAFGAMASTEWIREDLREPYLISGYTYINQVPVRQVEAIRQKGVLASSLWMKEEAITPENEAAVGEELFWTLCSNCHLPRKGFNALGPKLVGLDHAYVTSLVSKTDLMRAGMPPFVGNAEEAKALARFLVDNAPKDPVSNDGKAVWKRRCAQCHSIAGPFRPVAKALAGTSPGDLADLISGIDSMNDKMPAWTGNDIERKALAEYLAEACASAPKGGGK
jgi:mono/diheme cytochrome c family protein